MARHEIIEVSCDICNAVLDIAIVTPDRSFAVDGQPYHIDLCVMHTQEFDNALAPFVALARTAPTRRTRTPVRRRASRSAAGSGSPREIRLWARANGFAKVSDRGRVPQEILNAWQAAQDGQRAANGTSAKPARSRSPRKAGAPRKRASGRRSSAAKKAAATNAS